MLKKSKIISLMACYSDCIMLIVSGVFVKVFTQHLLSRCVIWNADYTMHICLDAETFIDLLLP